jgi:hypothetical protein
MKDGNFLNKIIEIVEIYDLFLGSHKVGKGGQGADNMSKFTINFENKGNNPGLSQIGSFRKLIFFCRFLR